MVLAPCEGTCQSLVSTSLNPDLTAVVADPDSESVDARFEVRKQGTTQVLTSGSDLVTSGETARFTVEPGVLEDGVTYEFRVTAADAASLTASPWKAFTVKVDTSAPGSALRLAEPLVVWDQGPDLVWTHYKDPSSGEGDDLVEYQVFRGCVTLPGTEGCETSVGPEFNTAPNSGSGAGRHRRSRPEPVDRRDRGALVGRHRRDLLLLDWRRTTWRTAATPRSRRPRSGSPHPGRGGSAAS